MYQQESIYNLIPKEIIQPPKQELYQSKFPPNVPPTGSTFGLHTTSFPQISNLNGEFALPRGAHPMKQMYATFGKPDGTNKLDPFNFIKKGHVYKTIPEPEKIRSFSEIKKPKVPTLADKPIMGLKSDKNYIISNAVDVILSAPKKKFKEQEDYLKKRDYGRVPRYLQENKEKIENEYNIIKEMQNRNAEEEARMKRFLNEDETTALREGLNKKLEVLKREYANFTHKAVFDTLVVKNRKETIEREMTVIEKDLERLNKKNVYVDMTKA